MDRRILKMLLFFWLLGLSLFDVRYRKVPVWMVILGGAPAVGIGIYECVRGKSSFAGFLMGMIPGMILLLLAMGTRKAGWADGIVLAFLGSALGIRQCIMTTMFSLILISIWSAALLILKKVDKETTLPYVPFMTAGFLLCGIAGG